MKRPIDARSADEFDWINDARHRVGTLLLSLYRLAQAKKALEIPAFPKLVDSAFCLWRAAFLVYEDHSWAKGMSQTEQILHELVAHNRIGYEQEKIFPHWFAGFYVNTAEGRVRSAYDRMFSTPGEKVQGLDKHLGVRDVVERQNRPGNESLKKRWNVAYEATEQLLEELRDHLAKL